MFSKAKADKLAAVAAEEKAAEEATTRRSARKERRVFKIYGRTSDQLARSFQDRVQAFTDGMAVNDTVELLLGARRDEKSPSAHCFRDRHKFMEIGRPVVSPSRVPVRVCLKGGGVIDRTRTAALDETHIPLDGLPRIRQPPYEDPKYIWRQRKAGAELGPPMRYAAKTENERIQERISHHPFNSVTPWKQSSPPSWRTNNRSKWKGKTFDAVNAPKDMRLRSVTGDPPPSPISASVPFKPRLVALLRERIPGKEVGPVFHSTVTRGRRVSKSASSPSLNIWRPQTSDGTHHRRSYTSDTQSIAWAQTGIGAEGSRRLFSQSIRSMPQTKNAMKTVNASRAKM